MGRLPQSGSGKPGFNLAIITIVALHVVFFSGLLLQGCRPGAREEEPPLLAGITNTNAFPETLAGLGDPYPLTTNLAGLTTPGDSLSFTSAPPADTRPTNLWVPPSTFDRPDDLGFPSRPEVVEPTPVVPLMTEYKIVRGDTPWEIAQRHGITVAQLREANPGMKDRALQIGQTLMIPPATKPDAASAAGGPDSAAPGVTVYEVKPGDTLSRIGRAHGTTAKAIRTYNNLKTDRILPKQKLKIPPSDTSGTEGVPRL